MLWGTGSADLMKFTIYILEKFILCKFIVINPFLNRTTFNEQNTWVNVELREITYYKEESQWTFEHPDCQGTFPLIPQKLFSAVEETLRVNICFCKQEETVEERKSQNSGFKSSLWQRQDEHRTSWSKQQRTPCTAEDSWGSTRVSMLPIFAAIRAAAD